MSYKKAVFDSYIFCNGNYLSFISGLRGYLYQLKLESPGICMCMYVHANTYENV